MGRTVKAPRLASLLLHARLAAARAGAGGCAALLLCVAGAAAWSWLLPQRAAQRQALARAPAVPPLPSVPSALAVAAAPPSDGDNLALFHAALGERRRAAQYMNVLFGLAAKAGLHLSQGEYSFDGGKAGRIGSYRVVLPVKGSYQAIWRFVLAVLRELPFAALDGIAFRRENIGEAQVEARLRLTLYLRDGAVPGQP